MSAADASRAVAARVVVLRVGGDDEDDVVAALRGRGIPATSVVVASVQDRADRALRDEVGDVARYRFVAVTSRHAARRLALWCDDWPAGTSVATVGEATARAAAQVGTPADLVAPDGTAASLADAIADALGAQGQARSPVLFLAAASARADLADGLVARGHDVTTVVAYALEPRRLDDNDAVAVASSDVLVALSPRAVDALCDLDAAPRAAARARPLVVLGPTTEARALGRGLDVARRAARRDPEAVADAVAAVLAH
jgi:uroporphyrinogen-III synthase